MNHSSLFAICSWIAVLLSSCDTEYNSFGGAQDRDTYRNFPKLSGRARSPESVEQWLDDATHTDRIESTVLTLVYAIGHEHDPKLRMRYAELYLKIYKKMNSGGYGVLKGGRAGDNGEPLFLTEIPEDVKKGSLPYMFSCIKPKGGEYAKNPKPEFVWLYQSMCKVKYFTDAELQ